MKHYLFDNYILDTQQHTLTKSGKMVKLGTIAYKMLLYFVSHPNQVIRKEQLISYVWENVIISEATLYKQIQRLRKLLNDNHENKNIIETIHGVGFEFLPAVTKTDIEGNKKLKNTNKKILITVISILLAILGLTIYLKSYNSLKPAKIIQTHGISLNKAIFNMQNAMSINKKAFISQINIRNELGKLLDKRFKPNKKLSWERKFFLYYDKMNEEEHFLFNQIRAYTEGPMLENNTVLLQLINNNPKILQEIPLAVKLRNHLTIWLNKYHKIFTKSKKMALLYVGVEDGAPYPSEVDNQVNVWLSNHRNIVLN